MIFISGFKEGIKTISKIRFIFLNTVVHWQAMKKWLYTYFSFTKREFNGIVVLMMLTIIVSTIPYIYEWVVPPQENIPEEIEALKKLMLLEAEMQKHNAHRKEWRPGASEQKKFFSRPKLFNFDPNTASERDWQRLGLSEKQAAVILRYTANGGKFRNKEDLQKMYVISPENYALFAPYIHINKADLPLKNTTDGKAAAKSYPAKSNGVIVALNSADSLELQQVKGIGPAFARRIVKYRERLRGFYNLEQLKEVFGMDSIKYLEIKDQLSVDSRQLKPVYINRVGFEELRTNPYLSFKQINAILQYRKQHGNYGNIADLKKVAILPAVTVEKLSPYISFEHD
jgi:competence protein ComEA